MTAKEILSTLSAAQCRACGGIGKCDDGAPGDISFRSWDCPDCGGEGWDKQVVGKVITAHEMRLLAHELVAYADANDPDKPTMEAHEGSILQTADTLWVMLNKEWQARALPGKRVK